MTATPADSQTRQIVALYKQGHAIRKIAAEFGRSYRNVYTILSASKVTLRTKGGRSPAFVDDIPVEAAPKKSARAPMKARPAVVPRQPTAGERRPWKHEAACRTVDPETWYDPALTVEAKKVCATCPVRDRCLTFAMDIAEPWGVWGGFSEGDRRRLARGDSPRVCRRCKLDFVPDRAKRRLCHDCLSAPRKGIAEHRDEVTRRAAEGWSDDMIGDLIGFTAAQVRSARSRWKVPSGTGRHGELKPCGTTAACRRHERRGEPVDDLCLEAERRRQADNREKARRRAVAA